MNKNSIADNHKTDSSEQNSTSDIEQQNDLAHSGIKLHSISVLNSQWTENNYITSLNEKISQQEHEIATLRNNEEYLKTLRLESQTREKILLRRLATKEHQLQSYACCADCQKVPEASNIQSAPSTLLDPCINVLIDLLCRKLATLRSQLEQTQDDFAAWQFTPNSVTGKRLMARCRELHKENEELGRAINSGKLAKLEGEIALQKSFSEEIKNSQSELDSLVQDLDDDMENMQNTIYSLLAKLKTSNEMVKKFQMENKLVVASNEKIKLLELENSELKMIIENMDNMKLENMQLTVNKEKIKNAMLLC